MRRNLFTPLGPDDLTGSERVGSSNQPVPKNNAEKHDSPKAVEGQAGEQRRGSSKNSPSRS